MNRNARRVEVVDDDARGLDCFGGQIVCFCHFVSLQKPSRKDCLGMQPW